MGNSITVAIVPVNGAITHRTIESSDINAFQSLVGGPIEAVPFDEHHDGYVNEEGIAQGLPHNPRATAIIGPHLMYGDYIKGTLVIVGPRTEEGETTSVDLSALETMFGVTIPEADHS